jgi:hypothetical protein
MQCVRRRHIGEATYAVWYTAKLRQAQRDPAGGRRHTHRVTSLCMNLRSRHTFWLLARATDIGHKGCKIANANAGQVPPPAIIGNAAVKRRTSSSLFREMAAMSECADELSRKERLLGSSTLSDQGSGANPKRCTLTAVA